MIAYRWTPRTIAKILLVNGSLFFQSTCVVAAQLLSLFLWPVSEPLYRSYIAYTMRMWSQNLIALVQYFTPGTSLAMTFDESCFAKDKKELLTVDSQGRITGLSLPEKAVVTANHQIYADWIYIWCVAYLANAHGAMKIILKDSLKKLPGMQFFDFIFLKRKIAMDRSTIVNNLERAKRFGRPLWLVLFPEGTVIADDTRKRSRDFAEKNNMKDNRFTLLPRSTGLKLCLDTLDETVEWLYDLTIGYPGIPPNVHPEKYYTIQGIFFFGIYPKDVHIHIRRFRIADLPKDTDAFTKWVYDRWVEKDNLMEHFYKHGHFPGEDTVKVPVELNNSIIDLTQIYACLLLYLPILKALEVLVNAVSSFLHASQ